MDRRFGIVFHAATHARIHARKSTDMKIHAAVPNRDRAADP
jgi:hypothetical protein